MKLASAGVIGSIVLLLSSNVWAQAEDSDPAQPELGEVPLRESDTAEAPMPTAEPVASLPSAEASSTAVGSPPKPDAPRYSLRSVTDLALKNAAVIREHRARLDKAEWQDYRARWAWGPKLKTSWTFAPVPERAEIGDFSSNLDQYLALNVGPFIRVKAELAVPIYTFGKISTAQELAAIGVDVAKMKGEDARIDLLFQIKRAYYSMQLSNAFQALLEEGTTILKPKLEQMEEEREFGEAEFSTEDFRKVQIYDAEFDVRLLDNARLKNIAAAGIRYFTGIDGEFRVDKIDDTSPPPLLADKERYLEIARVMRPDWRMLREAVRARGLAVDLASKAFLPDIAFGTDLTWGWSTEEISLSSVCRRPTPSSECADTSDLYARPYGDPFQFFSVRFALLARWDIDFWQLRGKLGEAESELETTKAQYERAVGGIELEIEKLYVDATSALEKVRVQQRRLLAARRWRDQFGLSVETAGGDISEGIDPLRAFFESKALQLQARYDYAIARAALAKAIGVATLNDVSVY